MSVVLKFGNGSLDIDVSNFNLLTTGNGNDTIDVSGALTAATVEFGIGVSSLILGNGTNSVTVGNAATIIGGNAVE